MTPDAAPYPRGHVPQGQASVRPNALGPFFWPLASALALAFRFRLNMNELGSNDAISGTVALLDVAHAGADGARRSRLRGSCLSYGIRRDVGRRLVELGLKAKGK